MPYQHEQSTVVTGTRSGLPIIVSVHSTALGKAVGGCRLWRYPDWHEGLEDALRLSEAMTLKTALADLPVGGGKAVIAPSPNDELPDGRRRDALLDLGDLVESFGGRFGVGEDVGITAEDMLVVRERTEWAYCLPTSHGGTGDPSAATALGASRCLDALAQRCFDASSLANRRVVLVGLGQVGSRLAQRLADQGAELAVSDIDAAKQEIAARLGARWVAPDDAYTQECDVLVPAALGGVLSMELVPELRCRVICGPANIQLTDHDVADALAQAGIVWAPDFLVNVGGVIHGVMTEFLGHSNYDVAKRLDGLGKTLLAVLDVARRDGVTPLVAAERIAWDRLEKAKAAR